MSEIKKSRLFVVLGMHRSGTSAITRGLQVLGINLGNSLLPSNEDNPKGFWEDADLNAINVEMLSVLDSDWHYLSPIEETDVDALNQKGYREKAVALLRQKIGAAPIFGFKDPRVVKLLPFWKEVFRCCEFNVSYVLAVRHPLNVVKSLAQRDRFEPVKSYLLWLGHSIISLSGAVHDDCIFVNYDNLIESPDYEMNRMAKFFDLEIDPIEMKAYKLEFLDEGLRHWASCSDNLLFDDAYPPLAREIYNVQLDLASDQERLDTALIQDQIARWAREFERLKSTLRLLDLSDKKKIVAEQSLLECHGELAALTQSLSEREEQISVFERCISEREAQIVSLRQDMGAFELQIADLKQSLQVVLTSRSWRMTKWLRFIGVNYRNFHHLVELTFHKIQVNGGGLRFFKKVIQLYLREGIRGFTRRISDRLRNRESKINNQGELPKRTPLSQLREMNGDADFEMGSVNYYGYVKAESGLGSACRGNIKAFQQTDFCVSPINLYCGLPEVDFSVSSQANSRAFFNIVHMNADSVNHFVDVMGANCLKGRYNIGYWVWELAAFRPDWFDSFSPLHEIWVPSQFCKKSIGAVSPLPVLVMPHVISRTHPVHDDPRGYFNLPRDCYLFGFMFDCSSLIARKNPSGLIEAFQRAFPGNEKARLILKFNHGQHDPSLYSLLCKSIDENPKIIRIEQSLSEMEVQWFMDSLDCYVSPHRTEGFGLTLAEAMLSGKPVIATNYGGCTDYLRPEHAYPVDYKLVPLHENHGPYLSNYLWANPDIDHLKERLCEVFKHQDLAMAKGEIAQTFIRENFSVECAARRMANRMKEINGFF